MQCSLCPAGKLLQEWLRDTDITATALAEYLGINRTTLRRYMGGNMPMPIDIAARLEILTGIKAREWASTAELRQGLSCE